MKQQRSHAQRLIDEAIHVLAALSVPTGLLVSAVASIFAYFRLITKGKR
jgi:hypothetical protein